VIHETFGEYILGCGTFIGVGSPAELIGKGLSERASMKAMDEALANDILWFDTAGSYAGGRSESLIGRWLKGSSSAEHVKIMTKVAPPGDGAAFDERYIVDNARQSLARLGRTAVDALLIHAPSNSTPIETTLEGMLAVRSQGISTMIGACNISIAQLEASANRAARLGVEGFECVQNGYSLLEPGDDARVRKFCRQNGIAYVPFSPLAGGILSGKYRRNEEIPSDSRLALRDDARQLLKRGHFDGLEALEEEAVARLVSMSALALAWVRSHPDVAAPVVGPSRRPPHLAHVVESLSVTVTPGQHRQYARYFGR
jgi:aryl-alcohol dehydrogenase-like predicted oxidoreductase